MKTCDDCNGYGHIYQRAKWDRNETLSTPCKTCAGTGKVPDHHPEPPRAA